MKKHARRFIAALLLAGILLGAAASASQDTESGYKFYAVTIQNTEGVATTLYCTTGAHPEVKVIPK